MITQLTHTSLLVKDQEEALKFWQKLGFNKKDDTPMGPNQRWLTITCQAQPEVEIILQKADWGAGDQTEQERDAQIGKQPGFCFASDNIEEDYKRLKQAGVTLLGKPSQQPWGKQLLFKDLYGNTHVIVQSL